MNTAIKLFVYTVHDLAASKSLFAKYLGVEPYVDGSYYVGFRMGDQEVGLVPNKQTQGPVGYIDVPDIKTSLKTLTDAGAILVQDVRDVGGGLLVAELRDSSGNRLGLRQSSK